MKTTTGTLYIVATPIGNPDDISLRAAKILKQCDLVVCEEGKMGARLLHQLRVSKPLEELNEHNEQEQTANLVTRLEEGASIALISDAGTPLFADPGAELVQRAVQHGITIVPVPGASSVLTALVASCLPMQQFLFAGFLSREPKERLAQLQVHAEELYTVVLLETPYRLLPLLEAAASIMPSRRAFLGCNLTMPSETLHYGTVSELWVKFQEHKFKGEFVFAFAGSEEAKSQEFIANKRKIYAEGLKEGGGFGRKEGGGFGRKEGGGFGRKEGSGFGRKEGGGFGRKEGGGGFGRKEGGGFGRKEGGGFGRKEGGSGFGRKEGGGFGRKEGGGFGRKEGGGFGRKEGGGFGRKEGGGFGRKEGGGFGRKEGGRTDTQQNDKRTSDVKKHYEKGEKSSGDKPRGEGFEGPKK